MRHHLLSTNIMSSSSSFRKPTSALSHHLNSKNCPSLCRNSPSATLDVLIFIIVLFAGAFLIISYFFYIFQSLSLILPSIYTTLEQLFSHLTSKQQTLFVIFTFVVLLLVTAGLLFEICCGHRSRRCGKNGCKGLKKAMEFDLQLQGEDLLRKGDGNKAIRAVNKLPWKGGSEDNPDYECLRAELRKMAPPNGRAVLVFRAKCGCPLAKLEGWGPKRGRRNKKGTSLAGGGDHR